MTTYQPSNTYKFFFDNIIGDLLSQICHKPDFCLKDRMVPYEIGRKYEEYRGNAKKYMSNPRLDRHKLASSICGAIIEVEPITCLSGKMSSKRANEIFALHVGLNVIKYYMMYDLTYKLSFPLEFVKEIKIHMKEKFDMECPTIDNNICDIQEYESNLLNALHWTHHKCDLVSKECYHYDIWAYAKIFYHLELYNAPRLKNLYSEYLKNNIKQDD